MNRRKMILIAFLFLLSCFIIQQMTKKDPVLAEESILPEETEVEVEVSWKVDIKGAVEKPGVYTVQNGDRVEDVIALAGGLKQDANTDFLNLSKKVADGDVIWIYTEEEIKTLTEGKNTVQYIVEECHCPDVSSSACKEDSKENNLAKVDINKATKEELMTITGIGSAKADAIIEYRKKTPFKKIEDIKNVSGIGDSLYEKIKEYITVS